MKDLRFLEKEFEKIQDEDLKMVVKAYFEERVPLYFWNIGASSSGNYHPKFSQKVGGLVRHTKAVVKFAEEIMRAYENISDVEQDNIIVACLIHDTVKYGLTDEENPKEYKKHAENGALAFQEFAKNVCEYEVDEAILQAVVSHMGRWGKQKPVSVIDNCVHLADYVASRPFIDIPELTEEYQQIDTLTDVIFYYGSEENRNG